eukprot:GFYU01053414.1.p1 GENE.GFYU01053414.1~~GFYU01053414.1.p1  ORF type:complete len:225 (-),score=72.70 GFYU01053414.1:191-805(-)
MGRGVSVFILLSIRNYFKPNSTPVSRAQMTCIWVAGSIRGAIAFALAVETTSEFKNLIVTTTLTIVLFTTFVVGPMMPLLLRLLHLDLYNPPPPHKRTRLWNKWRYFDDKYMKPTFGGKMFRPDDLIRAEKESVSRQASFRNGQRVSVTPTPTWATEGDDLDTPLMLSSSAPEGVTSVVGITAAVETKKGWQAVMASEVDSDSD